MQLRRKQAGDTLIEVLMAMTVLAVVISGAYTIANRSIKTNRQTQDRSQATKVMESQFERIKYASRQSPSSGGAATVAYNSYVAFVSGSNHTGCFTQDLAKEDFCTVDNKYTVTTTYYGAADGDIAANVFKVSVVWDESGTGDRSVDGYYRVYDGSSSGSSGGAPIVTTPPVTPPSTPTDCASGGTSGGVDVNGYVIRTFTASGNLTIPNGCNVSDIKYLVIGGGGAGGAGNANEGGGGGGAGGYVEGSMANLSPATYTVKIGAGGVGTTNTSAAAVNGQDSQVVFGSTTVTAYGGGGGASCYGQPAAGGSGGGGGGCNDVAHNGANATQASPGFGNKGGSGQWSGGGTNGCNGNGGGGGGAGGAGQSGAARDTASCSGWVKCADENGYCNFSGTKQVRYGKNSSWAYGTYTNGINCNNTVFGDPISFTFKECQVNNGLGSVGGAGSGKANSITGTTYAIGGNGGAGRGDHTGANGPANTGNGGGGSANSKKAGDGGSGIVIIRYKL